MNRIVTSIIFLLISHFIYAQNGVKWCHVSDTNYNTKLTLVHNNQLLKNINKNVDNENFAIHNNELYYISSNNEAVVKFNINTKRAQVIGKNHNRSYNSLNISNNGTITIVGYENRYTRFYNLVNNKIIAIHSREHTDGHTSSAITLSDTIIAAGEFRNSLLRAFTTSGEVLPSKIDLPTYPSGFPHNTERFILSNIQFGMQDSKDRRFAIMVGDGQSTIKLFSLNNTKPEQEAEVVIDSCLLPYSVITNYKGEPVICLSLASLETTPYKNCAIDMACSNDRIYLLYSNNNMVPIKTSPQNQGDIIYEFDWNGELIDCHKIDKYLCNLMYDYATNKLYGISRSSGFYLQLFEIHP